MKTTRKKRIKVGQIGIGHNHGSEKMATFRKYPELFDIVGVVEPDTKWRSERANIPAYQNVKWITEEELFNTKDLKLVAVETDVCDLMPNAMRCIAAGVSIHMDKPAGRETENVNEFKTLLDDASKKGLVVQMGYMFRDNPAVQFCIEAVRNGWLGRVFEIHTVMSRMDEGSYRAWLSQFRGGAMYIFGCHLIDLIIMMLGKPERVVPYLRNTWHEKDSLMDNGLAVLEYPDATATVRTSVVEVDGMKRRQLVICGDEGTLELKPFEPENLSMASQSNPFPMPKLGLRLRHAHGSFDSGYQEVEFPPLPGRYDAQLIKLAQIVNGEIENPYSIAHELAVQEATLMASGYINK